MAELIDSAQLDDSVQSFTVSIEREDLIVNWGEWAGDSLESTETEEIAPSGSNEAA
jgi:hypothetical protein